MTHAQLAKRGPREILAGLAAVVGQVSDHTYMPHAQKGLGSNPTYNLSFDGGVALIKGVSANKSYKNRCLVVLTEAKQATY